MPVAGRLRYPRSAVLILLVLVGCVPGDRPTGEASSNGAVAPSNITVATASAQATVRSVTDGDTLTLADGRTVRLAQVDAPETSECFSSHSTAALQRLAKDKAVVVRRPTDGPEKEKYGRTLAEVMVGTFSVNEALVREGAAEWYQQFAREDADLARRLRAAEEEAKASGRGLWSACSNTRSPAPTTQRPASGKGSPAGGNCHPAYPGDCIPPAPPDLNCGDLRRAVRVDRRFGDPHGLDANDDGWGCESYR